MNAKYRNELLKFRLRTVGSSMSLVAQEIGRDQAYVYRAVMGERRSEVVMSTIAEKLGERPEDLWPEFYAQEYSDLKPP